MKAHRFVVILIMIFIHNSGFSQNVDIIKFESVLDLIKIPIQINGKVHFFIFDTGAEGTAIRDDIAQSLDKTGCTIDTLVDTHNNEILQTKFMVSSLNIGNSDIKDVSLITFPKSSLFNCIGVEGVIGIDIISRFDWLIDFQNHTLCKIDTGYMLKGLDNYTALSFYKTGSSPRIKLKVNERNIDFLFDSGANKNNIDSSDYEAIKDKIKKSYDKITNTNGIAGEEKQEKEKIILTSTITDSLANKPYFAVFSVIRLGESKIGNDYWGKNKLFFSWSKSKLLFKSESNTSQNVFGISFKLINNVMIVYTIIATEQIQNSGIKLGNKVKTINGKYFADNCDLMKYQINQQYDKLELELQNGKHLELKKEKMY
jgi:predicted aspartyl protease